METASAIISRESVAKILTPVAPKVQQLYLRRCKLRLPLMACRTRHVRDEQEHQQYQRHEGRSAVMGQIVSEECGDPCKGESGVGPLFELGQAWNHKDDSTQRFGDAENDPKLLRISHVC